MSHSLSHTGSEMDDLDDDYSSYAIVRSGKRQKFRQSTDSGLHAPVCHGVVVVLKPKDPGQ